MSSVLYITLSHKFQKQEKIQDLNIGLAKKFIWVFLNILQETQNENFGPPNTYTCIHTHTHTHTHTYKRRFGILKSGVLRNSEVLQNVIRVSTRTLNWKKRETGLFFPFIFVSWTLITLQYCSDFCHTLTCHGFTCVFELRV